MWDAEVIPPGLRAELVERKYCSDITSPALPQLTLAELIASGELDRHLRHVRLRAAAARLGALVRPG